MTENILRAFAAGPAGAAHPSVSNLAMYGIPAAEGLAHRPTAEHRRRRLTRLRAVPSGRAAQGWGVSTASTSAAASW